jgi:hypothetical protein
VQIYEAYLAAFPKNRSYKGGMHWKKAKGREYLFRTKDRRGYGKSLGPRSSKTEKSLAEFRRGKQEMKERLADRSTGKRSRKPVTGIKLRPSPSWWSTICRNIGLSVQSFACFRQKQRRWLKTFLFELRMISLPYVI